MNDEYLWQRTGEDEEIARLEKTLAVFRYRDSDPPALTIHTTVVPPRWKLAFAFGAAAALVIACGVAWFQLSGGSNDDIVFVHVPNEPAAETPAMEIPPPAPRNVETARPAPARRTDATTTTAAIIRKAKTGKRESRHQLVALTAEEKYAYRQLMLALSISSEKLKVVRNAIDGVETKDASDKHNDR